MKASLYNVIIYPIELVLEAVFHFVYSFRHNAGISILFVSVVLNVLLIPLYRQADRISADERARQDQMAGWVKHIRKNFRGDERFMILSAYYRKMGYHPIYALKSSISLLLQIPFFFAAYHFLFNLSILRGVGFLWIKDLGAPDQMLAFAQAFWNINPAPVMIQPVFINILPILMTAVNLLSIIIYTKGSPIREKIQLYILAFFFLVFLYKSPSGLVLYWTMNNILSLVRSVIARLNNDKTPRMESAGPNREHSPSVEPVFFLGAGMLTVLTGLLIPSTVIAFSPLEFVSMTSYSNPLFYVWNTFCIAFGFFLFWPFIFYMLSSVRIRKGICLGLWLLGFMALADFLVFGKNFVNLASDLTFEYEPWSKYGAGMYIGNAVVLLAGIPICFFLWRRKQTWVRTVYGILI